MADLSLSNFSALNNKQKRLFILEAITSGNSEVVISQVAILPKPLKERTSIAEDALYYDY